MRELFQRLDTRIIWCRTKRLGDDLIVYARNTNKAYTFDWSEELEDMFSHWAWRESKAGYLTRPYSVKQKRMGVSNLAHRLILGTPPFPGAEVDHIDRDKTNNRKSNLRWVTSQANSCNCKMNRNNTSGFKGVSWEKLTGKWVAKTNLDREPVCLGRFAMKVDAALCYDTFAEDHGFVTNKELGAYHWEDFCEQR